MIRLHTTLLRLAQGQLPVWLDSNIDDHTRVHSMMLAGRTRWAGRPTRVLAGEPDHLQAQGDAQLPHRREHPADDGDPVPLCLVHHRSAASPRPCLDAAQHASNMLCSLAVIIAWYLSLLDPQAGRTYFGLH